MRAVGDGNAAALPRTARVPRGYDASRGVNSGAKSVRSVRRRRAGSGCSRVSPPQQAPSPGVGTPDGLGCSVTARLPAPGCRALGRGGLAPERRRGTKPSSVWAEETRVVRHTWSPPSSRMAMRSSDIRLGHASSSGTPCSSSAEVDACKLVGVLTGQGAEPLRQREVLRRQEVNGEVRGAQAHAVGVVGLRQPHAVVLGRDARLCMETHQASGPFALGRSGQHDQRRVGRGHQRAECVITHVSHPSPAVARSGGRGCVPPPWRLAARTWRAPRRVGSRRPEAGHRP